MQSRNKSRCRDVAGKVGTYLNSGHRKRNKGRAATADAVHQTGLHESERRVLLHPDAVARARNRAAHDDEDEDDNEDDDDVTSDASRK